MQSFQFLIPRNCITGMSCIISLNNSWISFYTACLVYTIPDFHRHLSAVIYILYANFLKSNETGKLYRKM